MDVDFLLGAQDQWAEDSPIILQSSMRCSYMPPPKGKGGGTSRLPKSLAAYAPAEPRGGHTCHSAGLAGDQQGGTPQYLLRGL